MTASTSHGRLSYDKLSDEQHAALVASTSGRHVVAGPSGSGRTSTLVTRALALSEAGEKLKRPRPLILTQSLLRRRMTQQLLGGSAALVDVDMPGAWIRREHQRVTGRPATPGQDVDWLTLAIELLSANYGQKRSVVIDDADQIAPDLLRALSLLVESGGFYVSSAALDAEGDSTLLPDINPIEIHKLSRSFRNSDVIRRAAHCWGSTADLSGLSRSHPGRPILAQKQSPLSAARFAAKHWADDVTRQIAIVPMASAHVTPIANFLLKEGFPRARLFAGDVKYDGVARFDFLNGGIYVLSSSQIVGLGFDLVVVTGVESVTGDLTSSTVQRSMRNIAGSVRNDLALTWWGDGDRPALVQALAEDLVTSAW
jgi:hypothetical protein